MSLSGANVLIYFLCDAYCLCDCVVRRCTLRLANSYSSYHKKYPTETILLHKMSMISSRRKNFDPSTNRNGKDLLQLCRSLGLYIANGRLRGDSLGRFTFCSPLGNSTVDYMVTNIDPFSIRSFTVKPLTPLSDHSCAS